MKHKGNRSKTPLDTSKREAIKAQLRLDGLSPNRRRAVERICLEFPNAIQLPGEATDAAKGFTHSIFLKPITAPK